MNRLVTGVEVTFSVAKNSLHFIQKKLTNKRFHYMHQQLTGTLGVNSEMCHIPELWKGKAPKQGQNLAQPYRSQCPYQDSENVSKLFFDENLFLV